MSPGTALTSGELLEAQPFSHAALCGPDTGPSHPRARLARTRGSISPRTPAGGVLSRRPAPRTQHGQHATVSVWLAEPRFEGSRSFARRDQPSLEERPPGVITPPYAQRRLSAPSGPRFSLGGDASKSPRRSQEAEVHHAKLPDHRRVTHSRPPTTWRAGTSKPLADPLHHRRHRLAPADHRHGQRPIWSPGAFALLASAELTTVRCGARPAVQGRWSASVLSTGTGSPAAHRRVFHRR